MTRSGLLAAVVALGSFTASATILAAPQYQPAPAQVSAEYACRAQNVEPSSADWELCLSYVTRAYEWGEPALALQLAQAAGDARESCQGYGLRPESIGYRSCVDREIDARSQLLILGEDTSGTNVARAHEE